MSLFRFLKAGLQFIWFLPRNLLIAVLWLYQKTLSPDHSCWAKAFHLHGYCKYHPTCSEYARQALKKFGLFKGLLKSGYRVLRCNPWSEGGIDQP